MTDERMPPLTYSNQQPEGYNDVNGCLYIVGFIVLLMFALGIGLFFMETDWLVASIFLFAFGTIFGIGVLFMLFTKGDSEIHVYQFEMNEDGIFEYRKNRETGEESATEVLYQAIKKVLITNGVYYFRGSKQTGISFYRFSVYFIITDQDNETFIYHVEDKEKFDKWLYFLTNAACPIYYSEYNISPAIPDIESIAKIDGVPWESVKTKPLVGEEKLKNPYPDYEPENHR